VRRTTRLLAAASLAALIAACTTSPTGRSQLMLISPESAIVQSKQAYLTTMDELDKDNKLVDDPLMADRVATITGRLVTEAVALYPHTKDWEWSVAIIDDDDTVNAWCMAGGRMAAYTGLFDQLGLTDDEFAQIMGHEISHALANHTAERMSRAIAINARRGRRGGRLGQPRCGHGRRRRSGQAGAGAPEQPCRRGRGGPHRHRAGDPRRLRPGGGCQPVGEDGRTL
jgi:Zn-dependent protease with chaperone function